MKCNSGKVQYHDQEAALRKAAGLMISNRLEGNIPLSVGLHPYQCESCGSWHVGHRPGTQRLRVGKAVLREV